MTTDEEYAFVSEMLQDNGGCRLPCWWGFTPGEISWEATKTFFVSLGKRIHSVDNNIENYTVYFVIPGYYESGQSYIGKDGTLDAIGIYAVPPTGEDGYPAYRDPRFVQDWRAYTLSQILEVYGSPQQVLLETYNNTLALPFRLLLVYPDLGFLVMYQGPIGEDGQYFRPPEAVEAGEPIRICLWRSGVVLLSLWSPEYKVTFEDLRPMIGSAANPDHLHSLEEATGMSIEQFYQTFVQPENQTCLETPADIW
jgi:hypothetical protein